MHCRPKVPGLLLCLAAALVGMVINGVVPVVSALLVAIILGVIVGNVMEVPASWGPGVAFSAKPLLRAGIVVLGLKVSLGDVAGLGWPIVLLVLSIIGIGVVGSYWIGRALGLDQELSMLVASGFSICGAAAVAAVDGVIKPAKDRVATAIGLVVLYGTLMIPLTSVLARAWHLDDRAAAIWIGGGTHEVAQVVASAGILGGGVLAVAVLVKLARVVLLAPVMVGVSLWQRKRAGAADGTRPPIMPLFVALFILMLVVRSLVPLPALLLFWCDKAQTLLLSMAMFALGLGVNRTALAATGVKALIFGLLATVLVNAVAFGGAIVLG